MSEPLTTQFLYNRWAGQSIPSGSQVGNNLVLQAMIDTVSDAVAVRLDRTFAVATRREWLDGSGTQTIQVHHWPIQMIYGLGVSSQDCLELWNTSGQFASCYTTDTELNLYSMVNGVEIIVAELTWAAYPTLTLLAAQIALQSGWSAKVLSNLGTKPSITIRPLLTGYCVYPDTFILETVDEFEECQKCAQSDRSIQRRYGVPFPPGLSNVLLWYKAGYTLPVDNTDHASLSVAGTVPSDLTQAINAIVKAIIDGSDDLLGGSQGGSIGDYNYQLSPSARSIMSVALAENMPALMPYRRVAYGI